VLLVERNPRAVQALRANVNAVGISGAQIVRAPVERVMGTTPGQPFDVVFLDPPYAFDDESLTSVLDRVADGAWLATKGVCVVERSRRSNPPKWPSTMIGVRERGYGEGVLWYGSRS
jgi:16S rRNA (guanine966-N2)-methyltransferase